MLAQKIAGLGNLLQNKISHEVREYYNTYPDGQPPDLRPVYVECISMEFGELAELTGVQETLRALAIWTTTAVHNTDPQARRESVYQQVARQMEYFGTLFPLIVEALPADSDEE